MKTLMKALRRPKGDSDAHTCSGLDWDWDSNSNSSSDSGSYLDSGNGRP